MPLREEVIPYLDWWLERENTQKGVPLLLFVPTKSLYTDASKWGYGIVLGNKEMSGKWTEEESKLHSNNLEMKATIKAIDAFQEELVDQKLSINSDNSTTVATINKQGGTKSWELTNLAWELWSKLDRLNCEVRARHIPGHLNVRADSLSRSNQVLPTEWCILQEALEPIWKRWGRPGVDLFATKQNARLVKYVSPFPEQGAWAVDAMTIEWKGTLWYAFPPWNMLGEVLLKAIHDQAELILIAPKWPSRTWYPMLLDMLITEPIELPRWENLLSQPHRESHHQKLEWLNLHAWRLSGNPYAKRDSARKWRQE